MPSVSQILKQSQPQTPKPPSGSSSTGPSPSDPNYGAAEHDDTFQKQWAHIAGQAQALGITMEQAYQSYNAAGRPRGTDSERWQESLTNPANAPALNAPGALQVTPDAALMDKLKRDAGIGRDPNAVAGLDPTAQAIQDFRTSGDQARAEQMAGLQGLKTAGTPAAEAQAALIAQLQQAARGGGPSAAQALFQLALGRSVGAINAGAAGVRGGNAAAASRNAGLAGGQMLREGVGQAAALRAQEQQAAQALLGGTTAQARQGDLARAAAVSDVAAQIRGMDVGQAQTLVGLTMAQQQLQQAKQQAATNTALSLLQFDAGTQQQGIQNQLARAGLSAGVTQGNEQLRFGRDQLRQQREQADRDFWAGIIGSVLQGGSAALTGMIGAPGPAAAAAVAGAGTLSGNNGLQAPGTYIPSTNPASDSYWGL